MTKPVNLAEALGAAEGTAIECLTLYIPSQDRNGKKFDPKPWIDEAIEVLAAIGGGATAMPPADGAWINPATTKVIKEKVTLVYTYIDPDKFVKNLPKLRAFLHRVGRETGQGEVVCEFADQLFRITKYDPN